MKHKIYFVLFLIIFIGFASFAQNKNIKGFMYLTGHWEGKLIRQEIGDTLNLTCDVTLLNDTTIQIAASGDGPKGTIHYSREIFFDKMSSQYHVTVYSHDGQVSTTELQIPDDHSIEFTFNDTKKDIIKIQNNQWTEVIELIDDRNESKKLVEIFLERKKV